jgi:hypothetical protein
MSHPDGLPHDMRRLLASLGSPPPPVDWATLDRLLAGRLDAGDAPPGYEAIARLAAATPRSLPTSWPASKQRWPSSWP